MVRWIMLLMGAAILTACAVGGGPRSGLPPLERVAVVDAGRFAGQWYVIANIPYAAERGRVGGRVIYRQRADGRFDDLYYSREQSFDAPEELLEGLAWSLDPPRNSRWRSRFYWPLVFDFEVIYIDQEYRYLVYGHPSRDYAWIMARESTINQETYAELRALLRAQGFDPGRVLKVPQFPSQLGQPGFQ